MPRRICAGYAVLAEEVLEQVAEAEGEGEGEGGGDLTHVFINAGVGGFGWSLRLVPFSSSLLKHGTVLYEMETHSTRLLPPPQPLQSSG